jgi:hypothetical protein
MRLLDLPDDHALKRRNMAFWLKGAVRNALKMVPLLLLSFGFTANVEAQPFANVPAPKLGPVALGMSLEEAQSALPLTNWRVEERLPSGKPSRYVADNALEWAGDIANVALVSTYFGRQIVLESPVKNMDAQSCLERAKNWATKLADTAGALVIDDTAGRYERSLLGPSGIARLSAFQDGRYWPTQKWSNRPPTHFFFSAKPEFASTSNYKTAASLMATYKDGGCSIELTMKQTVEEPTDLRQLPDAIQKIVLKPSIGRRHFLASSLANWFPPQFEGGVQNIDRSPRNLLPEAVTAQARCKIDRYTGVSQKCELVLGEPTYPSIVRSALTSLALYYRFDTLSDELEIDDPTPLQVTIPVTLSPTDVVSTDFEKPAVLLRFPFRNPVKFSERTMPKEAIDRGIGAKMLVLCQLQIDQSVVCKIASFTETDPAKLAELKAIYSLLVLRLAHDVQVCPDGCDIAPPVGAVLAMDFEYKIEK